jgi:hypothetical protein
MQVGARKRLIKKKKEKMILNFLFIVRNEVTIGYGFSLVSYSIPKLIIFTKNNIKDPVKALTTGRQRVFHCFSSLLTSLQPHIKPSRPVHSPVLEKSQDIDYIMISG